MIFLSLAVTGLLAGILGALLGVGGGIFLVPALTILFDIPIRVAVGTSLVAVIATSAGVGSVAPRGRSGDIGLGLQLEMATVLGAIVGSLAAGYVSERVLDFIFAFAVFLTAGYTVFKRARHGKTRSQESLFTTDYHVQNWGPGMVVTAIAGMFSGLLGVGGGFLKVPLMYSVMNVPLGIATATSNFMVGITAAASVFVYYNRGEVRPLVVVPTACGVFLGAITGVYVLRRVRANFVRTALIGLLILVGIQMFLEGMSG